MSFRLAADRLNVKAQGYLTAKSPEVFIDEFYE